VREVRHENLIRKISSDLIFFLQFEIKNLPTLSCFAFDKKVQIDCGKSAREREKQKMAMCGRRVGKRWENHEKSKLETEQEANDALNQIKHEL
jgi:hypothetical protein